MIKFLKIQQTTRYLHKNVYLLTLTLTVPLLASGPLLAESHFMFPSDVVDKAERMHLEREGSNRYETQREWSYPGDSERKQLNSPSPGQSSSYYPEHHISIDGQRVQQPARTRSESGYGISSYPESEHYKYDDFNANASTSYPAADNRGVSSSLNSTVDYQYDAQRLQRSQTQIHEQSFKGKKHKAQAPVNATSYPRPEYAQDKYDDRFKHQNTHSSYPNLLFPSDIEVEKQFMHPKYRGFKNPQQGHRSPQANVPNQIRYVPVPVYGVPGTLPGTVPGVVTPGNMVPGYSHLSPNYYSGYNNFMGSPFMPMNPYNNFSYPGSPLGSFYNTYGNNMPFTYPNYMVPGLSVPGLFPGNR